MTTGPSRVAVEIIYLQALESLYEAAKKQIALAGITCDGSSDDCPACNAYDELARCMNAVEAAREGMTK